MSYVQLSEGGFQVVYHLGLWSRSAGVVKLYMDMASKLFTFAFTFTTSFPPPCPEGVFSLGVKFSQSVYMSGAE